MSHENLTIATVSKPIYFITQLVQGQKFSRKLPHIRTSFCDQSTD